MIILYDQPYVRIGYVPRHRLLEVHWLQNEMTTEEFRDGHWQAITLAERYQTRIWLASFAAMPFPTEADVQWLEQYWYPRYVQLRLEKIAIINAPTEARRQRLNEVIRRADAAGHANRPKPVYFDNLAAARDWVCQPLASGQLPPQG